MKIKEGKCICSTVQYTVGLDDNPKMYKCHCIDCRKGAGSSFVTLIEFKLESLKINESKLDSFTYQSGSGKDLKRYFCKTCKVPVYLYVEKYNINYIYAGLLDEINDIQLSKNINFDNSHFPFLNIKEKNIII